MERIMLDSLSWRVKTPTAYTFLHLYTQSTAAMRAAGGVQACQSSSAAAPAASQTTSDPLSGAVVAKAAYLIELALLDYGMLVYKPSEVAASALLLSESWSPQGAALDEVQVISGARAGCRATCVDSACQSIPTACALLAYGVYGHAHATLSAPGCLHAD